jgi:uncharacterized protein YnzC (UPF0291/DUF896 family)
MAQTLADETEIDVLLRVLGANEDAPLSPDAARYLLTLSFRPKDLDRISELARKSNEGELTPEERAEFERFNRVALLLTCLKSKARQSLPGTDVTGQRP